MIILSFPQMTPFPPTFLRPLEDRLRSVPLPSGQIKAWQALPGARLLGGSSLRPRDLIAPFLPLPYAANNVKYQKRPYYSAGHGPRKFLSQKKGDGNIPAAGIPTSSAHTLIQKGCVSPTRILLNAT